MTATDYAKVGLKCGLEIHQQLEGRKLFTACPTVIRDDTPDGRIVRRLRAVAGETGEIDIAALGELRKERSFIYEYHSDTTSLIELDESPPIPMNEESLRATLQVAKLLQAAPVDQVHVMRKTVIDGSNTSGFQRTALVAVDGVLQTPFGPITVPTISVEEDAARIMEQTAESVTYRLDRLGIPLIEIGTGPDIKHPDQVMDVAQRLGMLLRSTGTCKRGLGTIRQDLNVSVAGGTRVEIKGCQELKMLGQLCEFEVLRQLALIDIAKTITQPAVNDIKDVTTAFHDIKTGIIGSALSQGSVVLGVKMPLASGILGKETQPGKRFGTELSDAAKIASGVKGMIHSDEQVSKYGMTETHVSAVRQMTGCAEKDAFVLVAAPRSQAEKALNAVVDRFNLAPKGVPKEVRKANADGTTSFMRPMPGAARMYPETDVPPIAITPELIASILVPERIDERAARYLKLGLSKDLADLAAGSEDFALFENFVKKFSGLKPAYIAESFFTTAKNIKRQFNIDISPTEDDYNLLFSAVQGGSVAKEAVLEILKEKQPVASVLSKYTSISDVEIDKILDEIIVGNPGKQYNALIGIAMGKLRGKAPGQKVNERLKAKVK
jgi:glutamyl-tRNA(Gln) amidotransferase subunit E